MDEQDLMSISQVCTHFNLTATMVTQLVDSGLMPTVKVGRELKFSREAVDEWMALRPPVKRAGFESK